MARAHSLALALLLGLVSAASAAREGAYGPLKMQGSADEIWPLDSCINCPGPQRVQHTGYQAFSHWTIKPGAKNFLPHTNCPPKTQKALAAEAIHALAAAGYSKTAGFLEASGALLGLKKQATFFAPTDEAFILGSLPVHLYRMLQEGEEEERSGLVRNLMLFHTLSGFKTFQALQGSGAPQEHATLLRETQIRSFGFSLGDMSLVKVQEGGGVDSEGMQFAPGLVVKRDMFCNALVVVHGVNRVLIPPVELLPAGVPAAPTMEFELPGVESWREKESKASVEGEDDTAKQVSSTARVMAA